MVLNKQSVLKSLGAIFVGERKKEKAKKRGSCFIHYCKPNLEASSAKNRTDNQPVWKNFKSRLEKSRFFSFSLFHHFCEKIVKIRQNNGYL